MAAHRRRPSRATVRARINRVLAGLTAGQLLAGALFVTSGL